MALPPISRAKADAAGDGGGCAVLFRTAVTRRSRSPPALWRAQKAYGGPINAATFEEPVEKYHSHPRAGRCRRHGQFARPQGSAGRRAHQGRRGRIALSAALYSPDMNPIEKAYAKPKAFLRKIAERSVARLISALETVRRHFQTRRMRKLPQSLRIRYNLIGVRFSTSKRLNFPGVDLRAVHEGTAIKSKLACEVRRSVSRLTSWAPE